LHAWSLSWRPPIEFRCRPVWLTSTITTARRKPLRQLRPPAYSLLHRQNLAHVGYSAQYHPTDADVEFLNSS
jgi:hypothetical protein